MTFVKNLHYYLFMNRPNCVKKDVRISILPGWLEILLQSGNLGSFQLQQCSIYFFSVTRWNAMSSDDRWQTSHPSKALHYFFIAILKVKL